MRISNIVDDPQTPLLTSQWTIGLHSNSRSLEFEASVDAVRTESEVSAVRVSVYAEPFGIYGLMESGVLARLYGSAAGYYAPTRSIVERVYVLGGPGCNINLICPDSWRNIGFCGNEWILAVCPAE